MCSSSLYDVQQDLLTRVCVFRSVSQKAQECFIYQLFPPSVSPSSPLVSPASPGLSPVLSPSAGLLRVSSVQALLESSFMHSGLKLTEVTAQTRTRVLDIIIMCQHTDVHVVFFRLRRVCRSSCPDSAKSSRCLTPSCPR